MGKCRVSPNLVKSLGCSPLQDVKIGMNLMDSSAEHPIQQEGHLVNKFKCQINIPVGALKSNKRSIPKCPGSQHLINPEKDTRQCLVWIIIMMKIIIKGIKVI